jgi:DNA-binding NtrC family response regulator
MARILIVDDDAAIRAFVERALGRDDHELTLAKNGVEALKLLDAESFDLMITDVVMPDVEGLQVLRELRKKPNRPKVIAMSGGGYGTAGDYLELARTFGAAETLEKPFTRTALTDAVGRVLGS